MTERCESAVVYRGTVYPCGLEPGHVCPHENEQGTLCWPRWEAA